jgi:hypothetical protein
MPSSNKDMATVTLCGVLTSLLLLILHLGTTLSASSTVSFRNFLNQGQTLCGFEGINPWQYHEQSSVIGPWSVFGLFNGIVSGEVKWYRTDTCLGSNWPISGVEARKFQHEPFK